jgi:hypothetical protein
MISITNNDWILLAIMLLFIVGDKATTYLSIQGIQQNFPNVNTGSAERNVMARWLMDKLGNFWGNVAMSFVSLAIAWIILLVTKLASTKLGHPEYTNYMIYFLFIIYTFVIGNNTYYALKYNGVI